MPTKISVGIHHCFFTFCFYDLFSWKITNFFVLICLLWHKHIFCPTTLAKVSIVEFSCIIYSSITNGEQHKRHLCNQFSYYKNTDLLIKTCPNYQSGKNLCIIMVCFQLHIKYFEHFVWTFKQRMAWEIPMPAMQSFSLALKMARTLQTDQYGRGIRLWCKHCCICGRQFRLTLSSE